MACDSLASWFPSCSGIHETGLTPDVGKNIRRLRCSEAFGSTTDPHRFVLASGPEGHPHSRPGPAMREAVVPGPTPPMSETLVRDVARHRCDRADYEALYLRFATP